MLLQKNLFQMLPLQSLSHLDLAWQDDPTNGAFVQKFIRGWANVVFDEAAKWIYLEPVQRSRERLEIEWQRAWLCTMVGLAPELVKVLGTYKIFIYDVHCTTSGVRFHFKCVQNIYVQVTGRSMRFF